MQDLLEEGEAGLGQVVRLLPRLPVLFPAPLFPRRRPEGVAQHPTLSPVSEFNSIFNSPLGQPGIVVQKFTCIINSSVISDFETGLVFLAVNGSFSQLNTVATDRKYMEVALFHSELFVFFLESFSQKQMLQSPQAQYEFMLFFPCTSVQLSNFTLTRSAMTSLIV